MHEREVDQGHGKATIKSAVQNFNKGNETFRDGSGNKLKLSEMQQKTVLLLDSL